MFANRTLAETYSRVLKEVESAGSDRVKQIERARLIWSQGFVAEAIDAFCRTQELMDVSGSPHRGVLTGEDMRRWQASVEAPLTYDYHGYTVCKAGPWSQGPVVLQQLALLKGFHLTGSIRSIRILSICRSSAPSSPMPTARNSTAIRNSSMCRWRPCCRNPTTRSADVSYRRTHRWSLGRVRSKASVAWSRCGTSKAIVSPSGNLGAGEPTVGRMGQVVGDTVHFDIVDRAGNMISATPSGGWLQSSPVVPELGFCLGTRAQMFWLEDNHPASLAPGKRPRTTLSPTMALRDGKPYLAWGSPGGDQQDQWTTQFFLRHVHAGMNLQEAIDAPAWHSEHFPISFWPRTARPGVLVVEERLPEAAIKDLRRRGHEVEVGPGWSEGRLTAASRVDPLRRAAANPRGMQGYAIGR